MQAFTNLSTFSDPCKRDRFNAPSKLQTALDQAAQHRSVIPVKAARAKDERIPYVKWTPYQTERATPDQLRSWWQQWPNANPVIVTGAISDLVAIDIDTAEGLAWIEALGIPNTFTVSRGHPVKRHLWFKHPGFHVGNITLHPGVEIKGDGGTIPAPGATHWSGAPYTVADDAPLADAPAWLLDLLRPVERPPRPLPELTTNDHELAALAVDAISATRADDYYGWVEVGMALRELGSTGLSLWEHWSSQSSKYKPGECAKKWKTFDPSKKSLGSLFYLAEQDTPGWRPRRERNRLAPARKWQRAAKWAILSPFSKLVAAQKPDPDVPTIGQMVRVLCSDNPKQALDMVECAAVDRRTAERRSMGNPITCIQVKGDKIAQTVYLRQSWLRTLFPPDDPITALIPFDQLLPEHFDNLLADEEVVALAYHPKLATLKGQQKRAVKARLAVMGRVERYLRQFDTLPFYQDRPVVNLSDLRSQVLRAILEHLTKWDDDAGELKRPKLPNAVQACLLGVTTGALRNIRHWGGVKQHVPAVVEHAMTHAQELPSNCRRVAVKGYYGNYVDWRAPRSPDAAGFIERNLREGRQVVAVIQPPAEQEVLDVLPERQPRKRAERQAEGDNNVHTLTFDNVQGSTNGTVDNINNSPTVSKLPVTLKPRRTPRQTYAAKLMVAILYHLNVKADKAEPLDVLAGKLRSAITPDRGRLLYEECLTYDDEDRWPLFINTLSAEDKALFWEARNRAGRKAA